MADPDSGMRSRATGVAGSSCDRDLAATQAPASLKVKLFAVLALVVVIGLVGIVEIALREHRNLAFESLKRDGLSFVTGFALSNPDVMLDGDESEFQTAAAESMRRPELQFIRFDSPRSAEPMTLTREGFSPPQSVDAAQRAEIPSSRLVLRDDALILEVIVPLRTVVPTVHTEVDADAGHLVPFPGSLAMSFDATQTQVALAASAQRLRGVQAIIAAFTLVGAWLAIRRALVPFELLGDAARRIAVGNGAVELGPARTREAHQLTLGLAAIQKQLKRSSEGRGRRSTDPTVGVLQAASQRPTLADRVRSPRGTHHVLLVEDNPVNRSVAVGMLEALGCTVVCAEDGLASLAALEAELFDLVFMDIQMPRMDGHEATRRIRAEEERIGASPTPIIALTAHSQLEDRAASAEAGMNGHISKPFTRDDLRQAIQEWSGSKKYGEHLGG